MLHRLDSFFRSSLKSCLGNVPESRGEGFGNSGESPVWIRYGYHLDTGARTLPAAQGQDRALPREPLGKTRRLLGASSPRPFRERERERERESLSLFRGVLCARGLTERHLILKRDCVLQRRAYGRDLNAQDIRIQNAGAHGHLARPESARRPGALCGVARFQSMWSCDLNLESTRHGEYTVQDFGLGLE